MTLFVDTSIWYAAIDRDDQAHDAAARLLSMGEELILTDHVLLETCRLVSQRVGWGQAEAFWAGVRSGVAALEVVTRADLEAAWRIATSFDDQNFSLGDCTSFAVMERLRVHRVASLDDDFLVYRFGPGHRQAFTVLR